MCEKTLNPTAYGIQNAIKVEDIPKYQIFGNKTVLINQKVIYAKRSPENCINY